MTDYSIQQAYDWNTQQMRYLHTRINDLEKERQELLWTNARLSTSLMQLTEDLKKLSEEAAAIRAENEWLKLGGTTWKS